MRLLYGTGNPAKLKHMQKKLAPVGIEIIGLNDMEKSAPSVYESGSSPLENARIKALAYFRFYGVPCFSCDSGLYFDNVPNEIQPGVHVRNVGGKTLTDREMVEYYGSLAEKYGRLTARYKNAVCLVLSEERIFESMDDSLSGNPFYIVSKPHEKRFEEGFPLDSLSVHIPTGKYYYDLSAEEKNYSVDNEHDGYVNFFENALNKFQH
jgi:8-oxo-dGTP diphosphatase